ncbi:MAG TPA: HAMP domain-containing sensor histidine kinase [Ktedonobacterales bacterium]
METSRHQNDALRAPRPRFARRGGLSSGWWLWLSLRWAALELLLLLLTTAILIVKMKPSASDATHLALYLALSGAVALGLGQLGLWLADVTRIGGFRLKLAIPSLLTALIIAFSVLSISRLMFISAEDSELVLAFLAFGVPIALAMAWSIAGEIGRSVARIEAGARRISEGDYGWRIAEPDVGGAVEIARLSRWFNTMADSVQSAFQRRESAESERRQVIAALSHDLRTPLASVRAMIEAIDDGVVTDPATIQRYQRTIRSEVGHLSALMDELFELSRLDAGALPLHLEHVALEDILSDALEAQREQAEQARVRLVGYAEPGLPLIALDVRYMQRVINNLLQNALRYTPEHGAILIHAAPCRANGDLNGVTVQAIDTGEGIAAHDLPYIFERTYRGEASRRRSAADHEKYPVRAGLGLAIAERLVEAHGGSICAVSPLDDEATARLRERDIAAPTAGTVLRFTLPISS